VQYDDINFVKDIDPQDLPAIGITDEKTRAIILAEARKFH
jgi:hypothetical protein